MTADAMYEVLLYYKYVRIDDPIMFAQEHLNFCKQLGLRGRIVVAEEGINGTVSGPVEATQRYRAVMHANPLFADMVFKIDPASGHAFKKMHVRPRKEIVAFKLGRDVNPSQLTGKHLKPAKFLEALTDPDTVVIDARNTYETQIGHFRNAILPDIKNFRDLPAWIEENMADQKDRKIVTYCTGGIRCEKFSGYLIRSGFRNVSQLDGGIVTYGKDPDVQGKLYDGKCYVFDQRLSVPINRTADAVMVGTCHHCGKPCDHLVNCANPECNKQYICCEACEKTYHRSCSDTCRTHPRNRWTKSTRQKALVD